MPNPNMLYAVTAVVVALLGVWIALVFKNAKEPWAKAALPLNESVPSQFSTIVEEPAKADEPALITSPTQADKGDEKKSDDNEKPST